MKQKVIITGTSSGIGRELALYLASLEHKVIAVARNEEALKTLQALYPSNISIITADITKAEDRLKIKHALSPEDIGIFLVHNAGVATPSLLADISEEAWDKHYLTNLKAPLFLTQLLLPHLKNGGRVLNVSSGLAHNPLPAMGAYGISKAASLMMKSYYNAELNNKHILFGSAMPGVVDTPIQTNLRTYGKDTFPAVDTFHGFFQRRELLSTQTAAKFLTWLLVDTEAYNLPKATGIFIIRLIMNIGQSLMRLFNAKKQTMR
jgi:benzil reductase ((S)-benzoin forming)